MSSRAELETQVIELVRRELRATADEVDAETSFADDLGADSLAIVEMTLALEETFDIEIPDADAERIRTVRDAIVSVDRCLRARHPR
jgi:acyl carrier protein